MKILFITNGHGEDTIAARIIKELAGEDISVMPIVGDGKTFESLPFKVNILGPRKKLPSGGFIYQSFTNMLKDVFAGLAGNTIEQIKALRALRSKFDLVVAVGDIVPIVGAMMTKTKFMFVGCAKSDYYDYSYTPWEKYFLKKYCSLCFPRDLKTHEDLSKAGIKSFYAGNPMMDCFTVTGDKLGIKDGTAVIGILPGTRDDAAMNMEDITAAAEEINKTAKNIFFLVAASPSADTSKFKTVENMKIYKDRFGDILALSEIVIGLSGTGNEQAAGMGRPVLAFPGRGVQYTASFARRQTQLLGKALLLAKNEPKDIAAKACELLKDKKKRDEMGKTGIERMGGPGASKKIAETIKNDAHRI